MSTFENSVTCVTKASVPLRHGFIVLYSRRKDSATGAIVFVRQGERRRNRVLGHYAVDGLAIHGAYVILGARSFRT